MKSKVTIKSNSFISRNSLMGKPHNKDYLILLSGIADMTSHICMGYIFASILSLSFTFIFWFINQNKLAHKSL